VRPKARWHSTRPSSVYPEVKLGDLGTAEVERVSTEVTEAAIDKTVDILRKQRRTFAQRPAS